MRFAALVTFVEKRFDCSCGRSDHPFRAKSEFPPSPMSRIIPIGGNIRVFADIGSWASAKRIDEPQRMTNAGEARHRFRIGLRRRFRSGIGKHMKH